MQVRAGQGSDFGFLAAMYVIHLTGRYLSSISAANIKLFTQKLSKKRMRRPESVLDRPCFNI